LARGSPYPARPGSQVKSGLVVAVMQPYFYPYAGYFRLLAVADLFVILDDVQFPRRGRVHRCEMPRHAGGSTWLTLPLTRQSRHVRIRDLAFREDARATLDERLRAFPWLAHGQGPLATGVREHLWGKLPTPAAFLEAGLGLVADALGLPARRVRSSSLDVDRAQQGQDYIIALAQAVGAEVYINAPGGRALYDPARFAAAGLCLRFLEPYDGRVRYLLPALVSEDPATLRRDILDRLTLVP